MKVTVSFDDTKVVVPCGFGDFSIRELLYRAVYRFKNTSKKLQNKQKIILFSAHAAQDGGILDWNDSVSEVLDDRELVIARYKLFTTTYFSGHEELPTDDQPRPMRRRRPRRARDDSDALLSDSATSTSSTTATNGASRNRSHSPICSSSIYMLNPLEIDLKSLPISNFNCCSCVKQSSGTLPKNLINGIIENSNNNGNCGANPRASSSSLSLSSGSFCPPLNAEINPLMASKSSNTNSLQRSLYRRDILMNHRSKSSDGAVAIENNNFRGLLEDENDEEDIEDVNAEGVQSIRRAVLARHYMIHQIQKQHQLLQIHQQILNRNSKNNNNSNSSTINNQSIYFNESPETPIRVTSLPNGGEDIVSLPTTILEEDSEEAETLERQKKEITIAQKKSEEEEYPLLRRDYILRQQKLQMKERRSDMEGDKSATQNTNLTSRNDESDSSSTPVEHQSPQNRMRLSGAAPAVLKWLEQQPPPGSTAEEKDEPLRTVSGTETEASEDAPMSSVSTHCERLAAADALHETLIRCQVTTDGPDGKPRPIEKPQWVRLMNSQPGQTLGIQIKPVFISRTQSGPRKPDDFLGLEVHTIMPGGRVDREGCLRLGDQILAINDTSLKGLPFEKSRGLFQTALNDPEVLLLVAPLSKSLSNNSTAQIQIEMSQSKPPPPPKRSPHTNLTSAVNSTKFSTTLAGNIVDQVLQESSERAAEQNIDLPPPLDPPPPIPTAQLIAQQEPSAQFMDNKILGPLSCDCTNTNDRNYSITLKKAINGLGFSLTSRWEFPHNPPTPPPSSIESTSPAIYIKSILNGGVAIIDGRLKQGDRLLQVDGIDVSSLGQAAVVSLLREKPVDAEVNLLICRSEQQSERLKRPKRISSETPSSVTDALGTKPRHARFNANIFPLDIRLPYKDSSNEENNSITLGVSIRVKKFREDLANETGEEDVSANAVFVRNVISGGAAHKDGRLKIGDHLLAIDEEELSGLSPSEALTVLKRTIARDLREGRNQVRLMVSRDEKFRSPNISENDMSKIANPVDSRRTERGSQDSLQARGSNISSSLIGLMESPMSPSLGATTASSADDEIEEILVVENKDNKRSVKSHNLPSLIILKEKELTPPRSSISVELTPPEKLKQSTTTGIDDEGRLIVAAVVHTAILESGVETNFVRDNDLPLPPLSTEEIPQNQLDGSPLYAELKTLQDGNRPHLNHALEDCHNFINSKNDKTESFINNREPVYAIVVKNSIQNSYDEPGALRRWSSNVIDYSRPLLPIRTFKRTPKQTSFSQESPPWRVLRRGRKLSIESGSICTEEEATSLRSWPNAKHKFHMLKKFQRSSRKALNSATQKFRGPSVTPPSENVSKAQFLFHGVHPRARNTRGHEPVVLLSDQRLITRYSRHVRPVTGQMTGPSRINMTPRNAPIASSEDMSSLGSSSAVSTLEVKGIKPKNQPMDQHQESNEEDRAPTPTMKIFATRKHSSSAAAPNVLPRKLSVRELKINKAILSNVYTSYEHKTYIQNLWKKAFQSVKHSGDPWNNIDFSILPVEKAKRHRYNALRDKWVEDIVELRMEPKSFGRGAMRECYRVKKLSSMIETKDWAHADNYVAKKYLEAVDQNVYFDDVKLQMDAKLWGEEFSRQTAVSRKVDIIQISILEMLDRLGKPLYHLEHFIEGSYRKYNSNSGFVDSQARNTPQAFSHFTFEHSGHKLIVVDIQGVGDLWTDPQIHTVKDNVYGDGNLGIRGMALFFHTHRCNQICKALDLASFDLHPSEINETKFVKENNMNSDKNASQEFFGATRAVPLEKRRSRQRSNLRISTLLFNNNPDHDMLPPSLSNSPPITRIKRIENDITDDMSPTSPQIIQQDSPIDIPVRRHRKHLQSECSSENFSPITNSNNLILENDQGSCDSNLYTNLARKENAMLEFCRKSVFNQKSSCVIGLAGLEALYLGEIHHELARLHESGRFARNADNQNDQMACLLENTSNVNWEAIIFHEECAAQLDCLDAVISTAHYYLAMDTDGPLCQCPIKSRLDIVESFMKGYKLMFKAALAGDRAAMLFVADTNYFGSPEHNFLPDWSVAQYWYNKAIEVLLKGKRKKLNRFSGDSDDVDEDSVEEEDPGISLSFNSLEEWPLHRIYARLAELFTKGLNGLIKDHNKAYQLYENAADAAIEALNGGQAMKYYEMMEKLEVED